MTLLEVGTTAAFAPPPVIYERSDLSWSGTTRRSQALKSGIATLSSFSVSGLSTLTGNVAGEGTLGVAGATAIGGTLSVTGYSTGVTGYSTFSSTLTGNSGRTEVRLVAPAPDPEKQYEAALAEKHNAYRQLYAEIQARLVELVRDASLASEPFSRDSLSDFTLFISKVSFVRRPAIYFDRDSQVFQAIFYARCL